MSQCEKNLDAELFCPQFEILDHSLHSFVQESIQGKISNSTPTKAT